MLKRRVDDQIWLISQPDHAAVSGYLAAHWGNREFSAAGGYADCPDPELVRSEVVLAIAEHDNGWWEWEADPELDPRVLDLYLQEGLADAADGGVALKCPGAVEAAIFSGDGLGEEWEAASRLDPPALILWAQRGDFPRAAYEALAARMRAGRVENIDAGHLVPMECPEEVAARALRFAAER